MENKWRQAFMCVECYGNCSNFSYNLVSSYFNHWFSKVEILKDEQEYLIDIFDNLNFHRMINGITPVLLNYGNGLTISNYEEINYNKNYQPTSGTVTVNLNTINSLYNQVKLTVIDWKLFKKENIFVLRAELDRLGLKEAQIIEDSLSRFLIVDSKTPIYKCIFFRNNLNDTPSLIHLNKILQNIHDLSNINDRNQKLINTVYCAKTGKKLTPEQANNISLTITPDGYGLSIVEDGGIKTDISDGINKSVLTQSLNNWPNIKSEFEFWEIKFQFYSGMPSEKISNQRENLGETLARISRVNASEKQYYKYIQKFLKEYQEYFEKVLEYQFDTLTASTIKLNANQQGVENIPKNARLTDDDLLGEEKKDE